MIQQQPNSIPVSDVQSRMDEILRMVRGGEQVTLTKDGEVVARVMPPALSPFGTPVASPAERRAAIDRFLVSAQGQTLGGSRSGT